ncbi:MAG TPA: hypothetical protein VFR85_20430 [Anaeromyxobacteraceae bacterium]|nr:hypothetical protein [Anaeromyxobacteraceae bacterium]
MFETLPRNRSRKDLALVALLVAALSAFTARLVSGPSSPTSPQERRASVELAAPARG